MRIILLLLLSSCAFKKAPDVAQGPEPQTITVSWESDKSYIVKRALTKTPTGYTALSPITLSSPVPWSISIAGNFSSFEKVEAVTGGTTYSLAGNLKDGLEISGLRTILQENKDQQATLLITARDLNGDTWQLTLTLLTLPVPIPIESIPVSSFPNLRRLISPNIRYDLLKVIKIKNPKDLLIEITGKAIEGSLSREFINYQATQKDRCSSTQDSQSHIETYPTNFFVFLLDDFLQNSWIERLAENKMLFSLSAQTGLSIGLFGDGEALHNFVDSGVSVMQPDMVSLPVRCEQSDSCARGGACREVVFGDLKNGTEGREVHINLSNQFSLRYGLSDLSDDPAFRNIDLFPSNLPL